MKTLLTRLAVRAVAARFLAGLETPPCILSQQSVTTPFSHPVSAPIIMTISDYLVVALIVLTHMYLINISWLDFIVL